MSIVDAIGKAKEENKSLYEVLEEEYNNLPADPEIRNAWYLKRMIVLRAAKQAHDEKQAQA